MFYSPPYETNEMAFQARLQKQSILQYKMLDWLAAPTSHQRKTARAPLKLPEIITVTI